MELLTLFFSGFTSATLLPGSSEALFLLMANQPEAQLIPLIVVVGIGNSLGGFSNWILGWLLRSGLLQRHLTRIENQKGQKAEQWLKQYGAPALFFSFLPIIGDPLCLMAGFIKIHWVKALIFITVGKFSRYLLLSLTII